MFICDQRMDISRAALIVFIVIRSPKAKFLLILCILITNKC